MALNLSRSQIRPATLYYLVKIRSFKKSRFPYFRWKIWKLGSLDFFQPQIFVREYKRVDKIWPLASFASFWYWKIQKIASGMRRCGSISKTTKTVKTFRNEFWIFRNKKCSRIPQWLETCQSEIWHSLSNCFYKKWGLKNRDFLFSDPIYEKSSKINFISINRYKNLKWLIILTSDMQGRIVGFFWVGPVWSSS